ncbi:hypothetical protein JCM16418A_46070 [Paenibacillus pini]
MMEFGQILTLNDHFNQHCLHGIPVQVFKQGIHVGIGYVSAFDKYFVEIEGVLYGRKHCTFLSRSGY